MTISAFSSLAAQQRSAANVRQDAGVRAALAGAADSPDAAAGLTLVGTDQHDRLTGGMLDDRITGLGGWDVLEGKGGNDEIDGGDGPDLLVGNDGADILHGGGGRDTLCGGAAGRFLVSSGGDSLLDGDDRLYGGDGDDELYAGYGNDLLDGGAGRDIFSLFSSPGPLSVTVTGGAGDDIVWTGGGLSTERAEITGGSGSDTYVAIPSRQDADIQILDFELGAGGDRLDVGWNRQFNNPFGAAGFVRLVQSGNDTLVQKDADGAAGRQFGFHTTLILRGILATDVSATNIATGHNPDGSEGLRFVGTARDDDFGGSGHGDTLSGGDGGDSLSGSPGDDLVDGEEGNDYLSGDDGNDTLTGGNGNDALSGGTGDDELNGGYGNDTMRGEGGNDLMIGGEGNDHLSAERGNDTLIGGNGDDFLSDSFDGGACVLDGGAGNDTLSASNSDSELNGGAGDDSLSFWTGAKGVTVDNGVFGGSGNDTIRIYMEYGRLLVSGGAGDDLLSFTDEHPGDAAVTASGGTGVDTYAVRPLSSQKQVTIKDFSAGAGGDLIWLLVAPQAQPDRVFVDGIALLIQSGSSTIVKIDPDGSAGVRPAQTAAVLQDVVASTLTLENFIVPLLGEDAAAAPLQLVGVAPAGLPAF